MFKTKINEKIPRTLVKAVTWRSGVTITNILIGWVVTGDPLKGLAVGMGALVVNSILYIIHERIWLKVSWGIGVQPQVSDVQR